MDAAQVAVNSKFGIDEEEELKKKIVLYYHTLVSNRLSLRSKLSMRFCALCSFKESCRSGSC